MPVLPSTVRAARIGIGAWLVPALVLVTAFSARDSASAPRRITITTYDYTFVGPDTVAAGITTITLQNRGKELHHVQLVRLGQGRSVQDFLAALKAGGPPPAWAHDVGGPNTPVPGGVSEATLELVAGRYALVCFIPSSDGVLHIMKGMVKEVVVTDAPGAKGKVGKAGKARRSDTPVPSVTMTLDDYAFRLSSPLQPGRVDIRVRNNARQTHEVLLVQLAPGKTAQEFAGWAEKQVGLPPGKPIGGTTGIEPRGWNDVHVTLTPGEYALLCFIPDAKDGKPHVAHGMATQISVK